MSGHNKWAQIKRKKAVVDSRRGKMFTRFIREITIAARLGGGDPEGNPRLRLAIEKARKSSMPADNIKRAIDRGLGKDGADSFEELTYEVYGPGGVAIIVETATDNRNRTIGEMRHILSKYGGNLGESGSVSWMFEKKGIITIDKKTVDEDKLLMVTLEAGADDLRTVDPDEYEVVTSPASFENVRNVLEQQGIAVNDAKLSLLPANVVHISGEESERLLKLLEAIEDNDDVQNVYTNADWD